MKTRITAKDIDDRIRALKNLREPAYRVVCLYLPNECRALRDISPVTREHKKSSAETSASQRPAA